jgi:hypothetical protein
MGLAALPGLIDAYLRTHHATSIRFAAAKASLAQATWNTYVWKRDVSNGSATDGHEFDWATPDVRAPFRSWPLAFAPSPHLTLSEAAGFIKGVSLRGDRGGLILAQQVGQLSKVHRNPPCLVPVMPSNARGSPRQLDR